MEEKLITIVVLPYAKAHILKMRFEAKEIECDLENINLIEGAASSTVRVNILEKDLSKAIPILDEFLGKKSFISETEAEPNERHILVPIDFSSNSEMACKMAFNIAKHLQVKLVFMHSYINPIIHSIPFSDVYAYDSALLTKVEFSEKNANINFQKFVSKMADEIGREKWDEMNPEYIIKSGYADEDILAYAHENKSQLIVLGGTGKSKHNETIGSVTVDVMYNARVPVLIVPENTPDLELEYFSKVLYATNFDEKDFVALDKLMSILYPFNIKVVCAHVGQPKGNGWDLAKLNGMKDVLIEKYRSETFECRLIIGDDTLDSLEHFIEDEKIDILSLTTHKRNMISRLFNPSLARKMIFHTNTPLLVFHA
ncbi:universal stress protein [Draconibacterium sp.]|nr:universal stress protein [Draconibacterium sp.]